MNKTFFKMLFSDKVFILILLLLIVFSSVFAQLVPYFQGLIVDDVLVSLDKSLLVMLCISIFAVLILDSLCRLLTNWYMINYGYKTAGKIQNEIFKKIVNKPYDFFEGKNHGDILFRINTYVYDIGNFISKDISDLALAISQMTIIFVFLFALEPYFALFLTLLYALIFFVIYLFVKVLIKKSKKTLNKELHRNSVIFQNIEGVETYLAYNTSSTTMQSYNNANAEFGKAWSSFYKTTNKFFPIIDFLVCIGTVIIYIVASTYIIHILQIGIIISILAYSSATISPMSVISKGLANFFDTSVVLNEVLEFANEPKKNQTNKKDLVSNKIDIICDNVSYKNKKNNSDIKQLNLKIKHGEKILLFGKYGSGKTSFSGLLAGLYKADSGKITFNGVDINEISKASLASLISVTSDYVGIFKASVYDNIKFAKPDASEKEILNAIKMSGLNNIIEKLENGYKTVINPSYVSEGDKQLISFARIILKNTPVVVVDEVTRDMEIAVKNKFLTTLQKFTKNKTLIYISNTNKVNFEFDKKIEFNKLIKKS